MNHIENLIRYINEDDIYQEYKRNGITKDMSDFDKFCIGHCEDIEAVLREEKGEPMNIKFYYNEKDFVKNDGVKLSKERIQEMIDDVVKRLDKPGEYSFSSTGDTIIIGFRWDKEVSIYVCKNYEHAEAWVENGNWVKMDWSRDYEEEEIQAEKDNYRGYSKEELIDMLIKKPRKPEYNPHKEV